MKYCGDFTPGKTVRLRFNTHQADGTPITLAGSPAVSVYKGSTAESTAGVTLTVDYDSRTGLHDVVIDTSADGTFYAAGNDFDVVVTAGTVNSVSVVGTVLGTFSLANRSALRPTTADATLDVSATGEAGLDFSNIKDAAGAHTLSNITVPVVTTLSNLPAITAGWLTASGIAAGALNGKGDWSTYAGGAVASVTGSVGYVVGAVGSVAMGVTLADGAITEAKIATPAEAAGRPAGILGMIRRLFEWRSNKRIRTRATGALVLRDAADAATLETQTQSTAGATGAETDTQTKGV